MVEAVSLNSWPTVSAIETTGRNGTVEFVGITGPHWFRPRVRRVSTTVGNRTYTGAVEVQVVQSGGEGVNVDYVVDSNGMGTHTTLFGASGALEAAIATTVNRTIWVCTSHVETVAATHSITALTINQKIVVLSAGRNRPIITVAAGLGTDPVITHNAGSSDEDSLLRFEGIAFNRPGTAGVGHFFALGGGDNSPNIELSDVTFFGPNWNTFYSLLAGEGNIRNVEFDRVVLEGTAVALIATSAATTVNGSFVVEGGDFGTLGQIMRRGTSASPDVGTDGSRITHNLFRVITGYGFQQAVIQPTVFSDNVVLDFNAAADFIDLGTAGSTDLKDITIGDNFIRCSVAGARAIHMDVFAGAFYNISITGNALRGPGSGTAIQIDDATNDCLVLNAYRDWDTNVDGAGAVGIGGDHGLLDNLDVDDHTIYLLLAGRTGGQTAQGGDATGEDLTLRGNASGVDGQVILGSTSRFVLDETSGQLRLPTTGSSAGLLLGADALWYRSGANIMALGTGDTLRLDDADFTLFMNGSNPRITVAAGDYLEFNRTTNAFVFAIGAAASPAQIRIDIDARATNAASASLYFISDEGYAGPCWWRESATDTRLKWCLETPIGVNQDPDLILYRWTGAAGAEVRNTMITFINATGVTQFAGEVELDGDINHDGANIGFFGTAPVAQAAAYTQTFATADRTHAADGSNDMPAGGVGTAAGGWDTAANRNQAIAEFAALRVTVDDLKQLVNAVIDDLQSYGLAQ